MLVQELRWLLTVVYFWSIRSASRREREWMLSEISDKRAKKCILNGTLQLFLGS